MAGDAEARLNRTKLRLRATRIRREADDILSFELTHPEGNELPKFSAGAHVEIHLGKGMIRSYSLCNDPAETHRYVVAVLREPEGRGGSATMHAAVKPGDLLLVSEPINRFPLAGREARFHLLLAGGIGVTPMMAMIAELDARNAEWRMHYCARSRERAAFIDRLERHIHSGRVTVHCDGGDPARGLDVAEILSEFEVGTHLYYCGPPGFMSAVKQSLGAWPPHAVHCEYFAAAENAEMWESAPFKVKLRRSGRTLEVPADLSILDVLRAHGLTVESDCEDGYCGTCITRLLAGEPDHRDTVLSEGERERYIMVCCSRAKGDELELDL